MKTSTISKPLLRKDQFLQILLKLQESIGSSPLLSERDLIELIKKNILSEEVEYKR